VVDKVVDKRGTRAAADSFLEFSFAAPARRSPQPTSNRPRDPEVAHISSAAALPKVCLMTIEDFGGCGRTQTPIFNDGGVFDSILHAVRLALRARRSGRFERPRKMVYGVNKS